MPHGPATFTSESGMSGLRPFILLIGGRETDNARIRSLLAAHGFHLFQAYTREEAYDVIYTEPPQAVLIDWTLAGGTRPSFLAELKADHLFGHLPVILMVPEEAMREGIDWVQYPADDYVVKPGQGRGARNRAARADADLVSRVRLCLARAQRDVNANPLTGLPGNITIMREAERRLAGGIPFAMGHLDIDDFKPFNDAYGFSRGDEVIRMTARILVNAIRAIDRPDSHAGHIGGDDFVFLVPPEETVRTCERILRDFDAIVPDFYDDEDRRTGFITSVDRKGNVQKYPPMTLSIAVVDTRDVEIAHLAGLSARIAEVKHFTKQLPGSNYIVDRRK